jgi:hypothetical protein
MALELGLEANHDSQKFASQTCRIHLPFSVWRRRFSESCAHPVYVRVPRLRLRLLPSPIWGNKNTGCLE